MNELIGRARGGVARAKNLSNEDKHLQARKAAMARWSSDVKKATHGSEDTPLKIGEINIPCYVLEDETRVISQRGLQGGIGMSLSGARSGGDQRLAVFLDGLQQRGVDTKGLADKIRNPIRFKPERGGAAYGYEATILADICDVILSARKQSKLLPNQTHYADACEVLIRGFARVGIVALIDEATGFQKDRTRDALARILDAFIASELQPWLRTFPSEFYQQMFRLRDLEYNPHNVRRPQYFGVLTNNVVYDRLAPGVKEELQRGVPRNDHGRPTAKYFQKLTQHTGYPKLREHLGSIVTLMKLSNNWDDFIEKLDRIHPRHNHTMPLPLEYKQDKDDGTGL